MKYIYCSAVVLLFSQNQGLLADSKPAKPQEKTHVQAGISYQAAAGNVDANKVGLTFGVKYSPENWRHITFANFDRTEVFGNVNKRELSFYYKAGYFFNNKNYLFNYISYDENEFANVDHKVVEAVGYGHDFISSPQQSLNMEAGIGIRQTKGFYTDTKEDETVGYVGVSYRKAFSEKVLFKQNLTYITGKSNDTTDLTTNLDFGITENITVGLEYVVKHNSDVAPNIEKTDTTSDVNIKYKF